jgi:hypothetical protein
MMAELNTNLISSIGQNTVDPAAAAGKAYQLKDMIDQSQINSYKAKQAKSDAEDQQKIKSILSGADLSDNEVRNEKFSEITKVNPEMGMKLQQSWNDSAKSKNDYTQSQLDNLKEQNESIGQSVLSVYEKYTDLIKQGVPEAQARASVQPLYLSAIGDLSKQKTSDGTPMLDKNHLDDIAKNPLFNPDTAAHWIANTTKSRVALENYQKTVLDAKKADTAQRGEQEKERHDRETEEEKHKNDELQNIMADPKRSSAMVKAIGHYQIAPLTGMALRTPAGMSMMSQVAEQFPDYHAEQYGEYAKAYKDWATGKQGDKVNSLNVATAHLSVLDQLVNALANGDVQQVNRLRQAYKKQFGEDAPTNLQTAALVAGQEATKAIVAAGGSADEREKATGAFSVNASPAQLHGAAETYRKLFAGQLAGLGLQYKNSTGRDDFETHLFPQVQQILKQGEQQTQQTPATKPKSKADLYKQYGISDGD